RGGRRAQPRGTAAWGGHLGGAAPARRRPDAARAVAVGARLDTAPLDFDQHPLVLDVDLIGAQVGAGRAALLPAGGNMDAPAGPGAFGALAAPVPWREKRGVVRADRRGREYSAVKIVERRRAAASLAFEHAAGGYLAAARSLDPRHAACHAAK